VRRQTVFEIQDPEQSGLLEKRKAEHGTWAVLANVLIGREDILTCRIV
jgi:hypothetical protein